MKQQHSETKRSKVDERPRHAEFIVPARPNLVAHWADRTNSKGSDWTGKSVNFPWREHATGGAEQMICVEELTQKKRRALKLTERTLN